MISLHYTSWTDLDAIIHNPAEGTRSEIEQIEPNHWESLKLVDGLRLRGTATSARWNGRLMIAIGHFSTGDLDVRSTWCLMSKYCDQYPRIAMIAANAIVKRERRAYPRVTFEAWSISTHKKRDAFLKTLGFVRIGNRAGIAVFQLPALEPCRNLC